MRRSVFLAVITLALVTGIAMLATAIVMQPPPLTPPTTGDADTIHRFYATVNDVIATGDTSRLHTVVAPYFEEQARMPGEGSGRSGFEAYLVTLHDVDPNLRLVPEVVAATGDLVVTRVTVQRGQRPPMFTGAVVDPPPPWGPVDVLRIADGTIAERWTHTDGTTLLRPLAHASLELPIPSPRVVTVDRLTLTTGAQWNSRATGPHLLCLEEGELSVHIHARRNGLPDPTSAQPVASLSAGQSLTIPAGASFAMTNAGTDATQVVVVSFAVPQAPGGAPAPAALPPDVTGQTLAGGMAADVGVGPAVLTLGQVLLASGGQLSVASAEGPILIAVDAGQLDMVTSKPVWIRSGVDGVSRQDHEVDLTSGDGTLLSAGGVTLLRNVGDDPVIALVLTLRASTVGMPITSPT